MQELARAAGKPHAPLFAPLVFGCAAQIEAISPADMTHDATRLRKNASELRRMLGLPAAVCAVPCGMEVEALGGRCEYERWPPRLTRVPDPGVLSADIDPARLSAQPRLRASLDAVRQLSAADASEPVLAAALTGPATLVAQLRADGAAIGDEAGYEFAGRLLAGLIRLYAEAGAHLVQLHEAVLPGDAQEHWKSALGTAGNVARFHRIPPVLVFDIDSAPPAWLVQAIACADPREEGALGARPHGLCWSADPAQWTVCPDGASNARLLTTRAEVEASLPLEEVLAHVRRARADQAV